MAVVAFVLAALATTGCDRDVSRPEKAQEEMCLNRPG